MKGFGWLVILAAMLTVTYLVVRDLDALRVGQSEGVVLAPVEKATQTANMVSRTREAIQQGLDNIEK